MAGPYYVRSSDGNDGDSGLTWALAKLTLGAAVALAAAGERIYVDDDHQETLAADTTYTFAGVEGNPVEVIVALTDTTTAVADYDDTKQWVEGDTNDAHIIIQNEVYFWGINLVWGDGITAWSSGDRCVLEKSRIEMATTVSELLAVSTDNTTLELINTDVVFNYSGHKFSAAGPVNFMWRGGTLSFDISTFIDIGNEGPKILIEGVDLSSMVGGTIVAVLETDERFTLKLKGIKLNATPPTMISAGQTPERESDLSMDIFGSGNTIYRTRREYQYGYVTDETTLIVNGRGLYDGANEFSLKMVSNTFPNFWTPWRYHLATKRVTGLGSGKTFTVYILEDGNGGQPAAWQNDEVWLEVRYPDNTTEQFEFADDRITTPTTAPANQDDDAGRWTGETNGREQKCVVTLASSAGKAGPVEFYIVVANPSMTLYVCPEVVVS